MSGFSIYWNRAGFQNGGGSDGIATTEAAGPVGSTALAGGSYFTRYPSEGWQVLPDLPPIVGFPVLKAAVNPDNPAGWLVQAAVPDGVPMAIHTWVLVLEP